MLGLILIVVIGGMLEGLFRLPMVQRALPTPDIMGNYELGAKRERLQAMLAAGGAPDCFLVGSSVALQGLDPEVIDTTYHQITGKTVRCFNYAITGSDAPQIITLTRILVQKYHPKLIVYGTSYRDFRDAQHPPYQPEPWYAYLMGAPSLQGWLEENSYLYRYYATLRWYLRASLGALSAREKYDSQIQPDGFVRVVGIWPHIDKVPRPIVNNTYRASAESLDALASLSTFSHAGTTVIVVEMPLPPNSTHLLLNADQDYAVYIDAVERATREADLPFWRTTQLVQPITTAEGWADPIHLNGIGGDLFSGWVGQQLAQALP